LLAAAETTPSRRRDACISIVTALWSMLQVDSDYRDGNTGLSIFFVDGVFETIESGK
jgi:hypothetical protein